MDGSFEGAMANVRRFLILTKVTIMCKTFAVPLASHHDSNDHICVWDSLELKLGLNLFPVPEFVRVRRWPSCEVNQQILVWFHCDGAEPQWTVPEQEEITKGQWIYRGRTEHFINAHIEVGRLSLGRHTCI